MKNFLLGVATAAAALLITGVQGDDVQQDRSGTTSTTSTTSTFTSKNTRASIFWDMFPNILTDCNFGVEELEFGGVVSFIRPITCPTPTIVHINDGETFIRSHGSIEATNMFFVVHDGAKLTMVAEKAIAFHRDEKSTRPIFSVSGEVTLTADGWSDSFAEANTEDDKGLIEFENDGTLMMNQELRFTSNSIIVANAEAINQKEEQVQSTLSPRSLDLMRAYFKSSTGSSGGTDIDEAKNASKKPVTGGSVPTIPSPWASIVAVSKSAFTTWLAGPSPADALTDDDDDDAGMCEVPARDSECSSMENDCNDIDDNDDDNDDGYAICFDDGENDNDEDVKFIHDTDEAIRDTNSNSGDNVDEKYGGQEIHDDINGNGDYDDDDDGDKDNAFRDNDNGKDDDHDGDGDNVNSDDANEDGDSDRDNAQEADNVTDTDKEENDVGNNSRSHNDNNDSNNHDHRDHGNAPGADNDYDAGDDDNNNDDSDSRSVEEVVTSLKVGEVLRNKMFSADRTYAVWPGMDGSIMFAQYPATPLATETVDESAGDTAGDNLTETVGVSVLHKSNRKKARRALNLREELQKAEEEGTDVQKTDKGTWWNPFSRWGQPSERERKIGKKHMGEVDMTIDDRARLEVKVDGVRVLSKSGDLKPDFLNRFPRRRRKDDGYEVRVTADGIEVQLNGKTVWGGGAAAADTHDDPQHQERTIWGVSAADIMD